MKVKVIDESHEKDLENSVNEFIEGKDVIIIEDIIDSGRTISFLKEYLKQKNPNTLKVCSLLDKPSKRIFEIKADYIGFEVDDKFIVGYGLDDNQNYRHLSYVGYIE